MSQNKEDKFLNIVGLMSGTSLDGIDLSLISTNGKDYISFKKNFFYSYTNSTRKILIKYDVKVRNCNLSLSADKLC